MPHDRNGQLLAVGDRVTVEYEVVSITPGEEYCNVGLKSVELMPPYTDETGRSHATVNAKQCVKVHNGEVAGPAPAVEASQGG